MNKSNKNTYFKGNVDNHKDSKGWFVGQFMGKYRCPELETDEVEVCWKVLKKKNEPDPPHIHKKGVEIAIVISGWFKAIINGEEVHVGKREYVVVYPESKLERIENKEGTEVLVIKAPSVPDDKFLV